MLAKPFLFLFLWLLQPSTQFQLPFFMRPRPVKFTFHAPTDQPAPSNVSLSGSFDGWRALWSMDASAAGDPRIFQLELSSDVVTVQGRQPCFLYKFLVDGQWVLDPRHLKVRDGPHLNHIMTVSSFPPSSSDSIHYIEWSRTFLLQGRRSSYAFRISDDHRFLEHLHWGSRLGDEDNLTYLAADAEIVSFDAGVKNSRLLEFAGPFFACLSFHFTLSFIISFIDNILI
jgi:hypothetical protein